MAYLSPDNIADAFAALERGGVSVIAGGTDGFPQAGEVLPKVSLLDVTGLPGFRGISRVPGGWRMGGATRWSDVVGADLPPCFDGLKAAAREVGSLQIQNAGTLAGNLCNASPAADGMPPLLCLGAEVELVARRGVRRLPLAEFVTGVRRTARLGDELVSAVLVPDLAAGTVAGFRKLGARRYLVISIAMVAASFRIEAGRIVDVRVAVGACSPVARRLAVLEARLEGLSVGADLSVNVDDLAGLEPIADVRGSGEYRLEAVAEMVSRLLGDLVQQGVRTDG